MTTATLTTKGQITIPIDVRINLKVEAGDRVEFVQMPLADMNSSQPRKA
jgi:AbrB family looped-hinge helix DNA binding protein